MTPICIHLFNCIKSYSRALSLLLSSIFFLLDFLTWHSEKCITFGHQATARTSRFFLRVIDLLPPSRNVRGAKNVPFMTVVTFFLAARVLFVAICVLPPALIFLSRLLTVHHTTTVLRRASSDGGAPLRAENNAACVSADSSRCPLELLRFVDATRSGLHLDAAPLPVAIVGSLWWRLFTRPLVLPFPFGRDILRALNLLPDASVFKGLDAAEPDNAAACAAIMFAMAFVYPSLPFRRSAHPAPGDSSSFSDAHMPALFQRPWDQERATANCVDIVTGSTSVVAASRMWDLYDSFVGTSTQRNDRFALACRACASVYHESP
jgi:hypothetical protein